jgi:hypothetical protein
VKSARRIKINHQDLNQLEKKQMLKIKKKKKRILKRKMKKKIMKGKLKVKMKETMKLMEKLL